MSDGVRTWVLVFRLKPHPFHGISLLLILTAVKIKGTSFLSALEGFWSQPAC